MVRRVSRDLGRARCYSSLCRRNERCLKHAADMRVGKKGVRSFSKEERSRIEVWSVVAIIPRCSLKLSYLPPHFRVWVDGTSATAAAFRHSFVRFVVFGCFFHHHHAVIDFLLLSPLAEVIQRRSSNMASSACHRSARLAIGHTQSSRLAVRLPRPRLVPPPVHNPARRVPGSQRSFTTTKCRMQQHRKEGFGTRLREALATKIQWYPIPVGVGVGFLGFLQFQRVRERERQRIEEEARAYEEEQALSNGTRPKRRPRIRPSGPW